LSTAFTLSTGVATQPISNVVWMHRSRLRANRWNPNRSAPPEMRLLRVSILENGWTQPIVAHQEGEDEDGLLYEIVDGYHRWLTSEHADVYALTDGLVPMVALIEPDPALARMATVRHNRARGTHGVLGMADIVADLLGMGHAPDEIGRRLGMDEEEVDRLADRGEMVKRGAREGFNTGWTT